MSIKSLFENIANAIKNVYGTTDTLTPTEMPEAITNFNSIFQTKNLSAPISGQTTVEGCLSSLSSDLFKIYTGTVMTGTIGTNSHLNVAITLPNDYTTIKAVIPQAFMPQASYSSVAQALKVTNNSIDVQNCGSVAQAFEVKYMVLYV